MSGLDLDDDASRLLRRLREPGLFGTVSPLGCGRLALFRPSGTTTLGAGYAPMAAAEALVGSGAARWSGAGKAARLTVTDAAAPPERTVVLADDGPVLLDERESPLLWLHRRAGKDGRPQISDEEFVAGERFRSDLTLARMLPRTTMNWDAALTPEERAPGGRDASGASDAALAARQRVRRACERLGPDLSGLAIDVCGFLKGLDAIERERRWPARSAKVVLRLALAALVEHYGIAPPQHGGGGGIAAWLGEDARPRIMAGGSAR